MAAPARELGDLVGDDVREARRGRHLDRDGPLATLLGGSAVGGAPLGGGSAWSASVSAGLHVTSLPPPRPYAGRVGPPRSLYLHVPFCPQVCPYCDFHKMRRHEGLVARYLDRLEVEAQVEAERYPGPLETLYVGGGTPSHLGDDELDRALAAVASAFGGLGRLETTLEADPLTFDRERLARWRERGVTRLSIGLQSTDDRVLRFLGRGHDAREGLLAVDTALASSLSTSVDLITAVPGQDALADLERVAASGVSHVSVYTLTIEPYTPFARRGVAVDEERAADDYEAAERLLAAAGLRRYEVSNHARPGHESLHNAVYWRGDPWLALGPSSAGFEPAGPEDDPATKGVRTHRPPIKGWLLGEAPARTPVDGPTLALELLMTGLRTSVGVDPGQVAGRTGVDPRQRYAAPLARALEEQLLVWQGGRLVATRRGTMLLNSVLRTFFAAEAERSDG
jgi:putative oxygen-independent coproporphyrinogen III oxidase